jgi:hypothetical protein
MARAVKLMLSRARSPLTIKEMLQVFERSGRKLSKNGYRIIHRTLRRNGEFESTNGSWQVASATRDMPAPTGVVAQQSALVVREEIAS